MNNQQKKWMIFGIGMLIGVILFSIVNPIAYNEGGNRTVVQTPEGEQYVQFAPGFFWSGFLAKEATWPNQISVLYNTPEPDFDMKDNGVDVGTIEIRFNDATTANLKGITQYILPADEKEMILLHNTHRTPQSLVTKRLAPYTKECLQSSAQLMSSEKCYGGGRAQMSQDFQDQLREGVYLLATKERIVYDSLEKDNKRVYETQIQYEGNKQPKRKESSLKEFGITVANGSITDVDYSPQVDEKLTKIIAAATQSAISKQELMTAQQQSLTAKAKGEQALVETEYTQKIEQTKQVVEAQTLVKVAEQDKLQQKIAMEAAQFEAGKRKTLADVAAYEKSTVIHADGALTQKLDAYKETQKYWADAFGKYTGNVAPQIQSGGNGAPTNAAVNFMEIMSMKAQRDLALDLKTTK